MIKEEAEILYETSDLYLNSKLEILLNGATHAVVVGKATSLEQAKRVMEKLERYPRQLRVAAKHW